MLSALSRLLPAPVRGLRLGPPEPCCPGTPASTARAPRRVPPDQRPIVPSCGSAPRRRLPRRPVVHRERRGPTSPAAVTMTTTRPRPDACLVRLAGELDIDTAPMLGA